MMMGMLMVMLIGMLLFFAFVVALIWLSVQWLNKRKMLTLLSTPQQQDTSQPYERGYQPSWSPPETSQEAGQQYPDPQPQYEQPRAQYPQPQELPPQS
jgi:hypothetical protein